MISSKIFQAFHYKSFDKIEVQALFCHEEYNRSVFREDQRGSLQWPFADSPKVWENNFITELERTSSSLLQSKIAFSIFGKIGSVTRKFHLDKLMNQKHLVHRHILKQILAFLNLNQIHQFTCNLAGWSLWFSMSSLYPVFLSRSVAVAGWTPQQRYFSWGLILCFIPGITFSNVKGIYACTL